jgi:HK97 gp10 family phage protein
MANFRVDVVGDERLRRLLRRLDDRYEEKLWSTLTEQGQLLEGAIARTLQQGSPGRGRVYPSAGGGLNTTHQASAPGDPPASDTGNLINSIGTDFRRAELSVLVGTEVEYAPFLEYGTRRMAPRPFMRPAYQSREAAIERAVREAINEVTRAAGRRG